MAGRPTLPPGAHAFVAMSAAEPPRWTVRYAQDGEDQTTDRPRVPRSPTFTMQVEAYRWLDCYERGVPYVYPEGTV